MTYTRRQAMERAALADTYPAGMCAKWTREQYGIGPAGDADGDGDVDAVDSWRRATRRHTDASPPPGVPVYWSGGSKGHGHVAISWGDGRIRGTDSPVAGHIGTVPIAWVRQHWGLTYLGWSEDLNGVLIPVDPPKRRKKIVRYLAETKAEIQRLKKGRAAAKARGEKPEPWTALIKAQRAARKQAKREFPK